MAVYLIDSDVLINHLRRKTSLQAYLGELNPTSRYACSTITVAEVHAGMRPSEEAATRQLLDGLFHYPVTTAVAEMAGDLKSHLGKTGKTIALDDCQIAATALVEQAVLVTGNDKHYPTVKNKITRPA